MGLMEADVREERRAGPGRLAQPADGLIGHDLAGVPAGRPHGRAIAYEVAGVEMAGAGVVLGAEPMVEALVARLGLGGSVELAVAVPFAEVAGGIAGSLQLLGDGHLADAQVHGMAAGNRAVNADAVWIAAGEQPRAAGGADRGRRIAGGQPQPFGRQPVQPGCLDGRMSVTGQVTVAQVVAEDDQDVGSIARSRGGRASRRIGHRIRAEGQQEDQHRQCSGCHGGERLLCHPGRLEAANDSASRSDDKSHTVGRHPPAESELRPVATHLFPSAEAAWVSARP